MAATGSGSIEPKKPMRKAELKKLVRAAHELAKECCGDCGVYRDEVIGPVTAVLLHSAIRNFATSELLEIFVKKAD